MLNLCMVFNIEIDYLCGVQYLASLKRDFYQYYRLAIENAVCTPHKSGMKLRVAIFRN